MTQDPTLSRVHPPSSVATIAVMIVTVNTITVHKTISKACHYVHGCWRSYEWHNKPVSLSMAAWPCHCLAAVCKEGSSLIDILFVHTQISFGPLLSAADTKPFTLCIVSSNEQRQESLGSRRPRPTVAKPDTSESTSFCCANLFTAAHRT